MKCSILFEAPLSSFFHGGLLIKQKQVRFCIINWQQPSQLLYSIDILPARNSRLTQRETNHYITRCTSVLAWSYIAGGSPEQLVIDLFAHYQRFAVCCPFTNTKVVFLSPLALLSPLASPLADSACRRFRLPNSLAYFACLIRLPISLAYFACLFHLPILLDKYTYDYVIPWGIEHSVYLEYQNVLKWLFARSVKRTGRFRPVPWKETAVNKKVAWSLFFPFLNFVKKESR